MKMKTICEGEKKEGAIEEKKDKNKSDKTDSVNVAEK